MNIMPTTMGHSGGRIDELDYLKCIFILLMVVFHLTFVSATFPFAKAIVYTFHMPGFLIISGYLVNITKPLRHFLRMLLWLFVPYVIMETGYIIMASVLPINEHIAVLTPQVFLRHLLMKPLGPYWYLQTMILCGIVHYIMAHLTRSRLWLWLLLSAVTLHLLSRMGILSFPCAMYYLAGAAVRRYQLDIREAFRPSVLSPLLLIPLCVDGHNLDKSALGGIAIVYFVMSTLMLLHRHTPRTVAAPLQWLGRNTLPVFLFSPIFTVLCKPLSGLLPVAIPQSMRCMLFIVIALPLCVLGSMCVARAMEITRTASLMFGKRNILTE